MKKTKSKFADLLPRVGSVVEVMIPENPNEVQIFEAMVVGRVARHASNKKNIMDGRAPISLATIMINFAPLGYEPKLFYTENGWRLDHTHTRTSIVVQVNQIGDDPVKIA